MGDNASFKDLLRDAKTPTNKGKTDHDLLILATSPDSYSFQHFLDRVTIIWSQAILMTGNEPATILTGRPDSNPIVHSIYSKMVKHHVHYNKARVSAKKLANACRAPLIHPYTMTRFLGDNLCMYFRFLCFVVKNVYLPSFQNTNAFLKGRCCFISLELKVQHEMEGER